MQMIDSLNPIRGIGTALTSDTTSRDLAVARGPTSEIIAGDADLLALREEGSFTALRDVGSSVSTDRITGFNDTILSRTGVIDMINSVNYIWTTNQSLAARTLAPRIKMTLFQQTRGQLNEATNRFFELGAAAFDGTGDNFQGTGAADAFFGDDLSYTGMYKAEKVGTIYLPFFSTKYAELQHAFDENKAASINPVLALPQKLVGAAGATVAPGSHWENPQTWGSTNATSSEFSFNLYNTVGTDQQRKDAMKTHKQFIDLMITLNSIQKYGPSLIIPPVICQYEIDGVKYSPVANIGLNVESVGQITYNDGKHYPDAYRLNFTLQDMLTRSRNFHDPSGPRKVTVISAPANTITPPAAGGVTPPATTSSAGGSGGRSVR